MADRKRRRRRGRRSRQPASQRRAGARASATAEPQPAEGAESPSESTAVLQRYGVDIKIPLSFADIAGVKFGIRHGNALAAAVLVLLTAISYLPALQAGFVWDDAVFTENRAVQEWGDFWAIWLSPGHIVNEGHYWPIVYTSFWLEHKIWGLNPTGYHVVNVLLHIVNTLLLWRILARLAVPGAWLAAAVFAVHPLHVESVAWVIERKDLLSALFYFTAFLAWMRYEATRKRRHYLLALGLFAVGLLSKSIVVTLPVALLILRWWRQGRLNRNDLLQTVPFFAVGLAITAGDFAYYRPREAFVSDLSIIERPFLAARALWFYTTKLLWPDNLAVIYPHWDIRATDPLAWGYLILVVAVPALLWRFRRQIGRGPLAGVLFFAVTLSPTLGFIDYGYMQFSYVADRFQYLAGIGIIAVVIGATVWGARRLPERLRMVSIGAPAAVLVILSVLSWQHASIFRNNETLFRHVVSFNPKAHNAYHNLNRALLVQERIEEALESTRLALQHLPDDAKANFNHAFALWNSGRADEAIEYYRRTLEIEPDNERTLLNLNLALLHEERYQEALDAARNAIERNPRDATSHSHAGSALWMLKRPEEAEQYQRLALQVDPEHKQALISLAGMLRHNGQYDEAMDLYRATVDAHPDYADPHRGMGVIELARENHDAAERHFRRAMYLGLGDNIVLHGLGRLSLAKANYEDALKLLQAAVERFPADAKIHSDLGVALINLGRKDEAIQSFEQAIELDPTLQSAINNLALAKQISR